jgi:hypothetical protein
VGGEVTLSFSNRYRQQKYGNSDKYYNIGKFLYCSVVPLARVLQTNSFYSKVKKLGYVTVQANTPFCEWSLNSPGMYYVPRQAVWSSLGGAVMSSSSQIQSLSK